MIRGQALTNRILPTGRRGGETLQEKLKETFRDLWGGIGGMGV